MDLGPYIEGLRRDLLAAAAAGTEETRRTAELLGAALEPAVRLAIMDAVAATAAEVTDALPDTTVEVRLHGREPRIVVDTAVDDDAEDAAPPLPAADDESTGTSRITLRLPEPLKARVETAAARDGVSVNTWLGRAAARALDAPPTHRTGRRLTGFARG